MDINESFDYEGSTYPNNENVYIKHQDILLIHVRLHNFYNIFQFSSISIRNLLEL